VSVASLCIHSITVQQNLQVSDGAGGNKDVWSDLYSGVAARLNPLSAIEQAKWLGLPVIATHKVYIADASLDVHEGHQILYGSRVFNVLGVRNIDEWSKFLTVDVFEVR